MDLSDYLVALRRSWAWILISVLLCVSAAALYAFTAPTRYAASSELYVSADSGGSAQELVNANAYVLRQVQSYVRLADSEIVLDKVIDELDLDTTPAELGSRVTAAVPPETVLLSITVSDSDPVRAADTANAIARTLQDVVSQLEPAQTASGDSVIRLTTVDQARPPTHPEEPQRELILLLGLLSGLALGFASAVLRHTLNTQITTLKDIKAVTTYPVIGRVPSRRRGAPWPVDRGSRGHLRSEAIRHIRTNMQFHSEAGHNSYVITSSHAGEGKTTITADLAIAYVEMGSRVCLIDADLRHPRIAQHLDIDSTPGLSEILQGQMTYEATLQHVDVHGQRLDVIPAGRIPGNPSELLSSGNMSSLLDSLASSYDVVFLDSPPLLPFTDATVLSKKSTGAILVVRMDGEAGRRSDLVSSVERLQSVNAPLIGIVLSMTPGPTGAVTRGNIEPGASRSRSQGRRSRPEFTGGPENSDQTRRPQTADLPSQLDSGPPRTGPQHRLAQPERSSQPGDRRR